MAHPFSTHAGQTHAGQDAGAAPSPFGWRSHRLDPAVSPSARPIDDGPQTHRGYNWTISPRDRRTTTARSRTATDLPRWRTAAAQPMQ